MTLDNAGMDQRIIGVCPPIGRRRTSSRERTLGVGQTEFENPGPIRPIPLMASMKMKVSGNRSFSVRLAKLSCR